MAVITFMSDFGTEDHYVASVKAAILKNNAQATIVDLSHHIAASDIGHASYVLQNVFRDFDSQTVHLCAMDNFTRKPSDLLALELEGHYFVGTDCGLFSLISTQTPTQIIKINRQPTDTFPAKNVLASVAAELSLGKSLAELGESVNEIKTLFARQLKVTKREISGNVIRIDHYGNLITNIALTAFETITKINGNAPFQIQFGRELVTGIHQNYHEVDSGECYVLFNSSGNLQIGINKGNASELLGLRLDTPVHINFQL